MDTHMEAIPITPAGTAKNITTIHARPVATTRKALDLAVRLLHMTP